MTHTQKELKEANEAAQKEANKIAAEAAKEAKEKEEAKEKKAAEKEDSSNESPSVHGMANNSDKNWANVVLQVLLHVPSLWAHVKAHVCRTSMCPAGVLKKLSSDLGHATTWGNQHCNKVFQDLGEIEDASEAFTKVFNAIRDCGGGSAIVTVDKLVGVGSTTTIEDCCGHKSFSSPTYNFGVSLITSELKSRIEIDDLLKQWIAPVDISNYDCKECLTKVDAKQTTAYFPPPPAVLVVTLGQDSKGPGVHFLNPVLLPGTDFRYNLSAVICCIGTAKYWAVVKKMEAGRISTWIKADDTTVKSIKLKTLQDKSYGKAAVVLIYEKVEAADPSDANMNDDGAAPTVGQSKDDNDNAGDPSTPGTKRTSEPKASPPPQSGMSGAQIELTDAKVVTEALHTHTSHYSLEETHALTQEQPSERKRKSIQTNFFNASTTNTPKIMKTPAGLTRIH